jgi:hypothetical protein
MHVHRFPFPWTHLAGIHRFDANRPGSDLNYTTLDSIPRTSRPRTTPELLGGANILYVSLAPEGQGAAVHAHVRLVD